MKSLVCILPFLLLMLDLWAQKPATMRPNQEVRRYPDSIRVEFPDQHGLMIFELLNYRWDPDQLNKQVEMMKGVIDDVEKNIASTASPKQVDVDVSLSGERKITIREQQSPVTRITSTATEVTQLLPPGWEFRIHLDLRYDIYVYAQDFSEIRSMLAFNVSSLQDLLKMEAGKIYMGRKRYIARVIVQKGELTYSSVKFQMPLDQLELNMACGLGYLNTNFYPELNLVTTFVFRNRRNVLNNQFSITYNNLFFASRSADGIFRNRTNSFINLAYGRRFGTARSFTWASVGFGYLVMKKGDYFTGKTMKLFFSTSIGKFTVTPELYRTNDLKTFQSGIKFVYKF